MQAEIADYRSLRDARGHSHGKDNPIVGYVVRETIRDGVALRHGPADAKGRRQCGYDVAVIEGGCNYTDTFDILDSYRNTPGGYAVVSTKKPARPPPGGRAGFRVSEVGPTAISRSSGEVSEPSRRPR